MPNGGSDCCGTCWFNNQNKGLDGYSGFEIIDKVVCIIRNLEIETPFWTYCANHPHHNMNKIDLPLGPVYVHDRYPNSRKVWMNPPDTETIRLKLLELLEKISNVPEYRYPSETDLEEEVIKQLTSLKEKRAINGLKRVINLDIEIYRYLDFLFVRNKAIIVGQAIEALLEISDGEFLSEVERFITYGLENVTNDNYELAKDNFAAIRYHLVRGLRYSQSETAIKLLKIGQNDPHAEVRAFANEILIRKKVI